jgi:large subunit ribosomal protein L6
MSRVGQKPIPVPDKIKILYENRVVTVTGEKGTLTRQIHPAIDLKITEGVINVVLATGGRSERALQGLTRSLVANMVIGVADGFERVLQINGIGYRAILNGDRIEFNLGYSHPIDFDLPEGVTASVDRNNVIKLYGIDKEKLGQTAASIRRLRPPEPYKGKGIKYAEETIRKKAGKTGTKAA